MRMINALNLTQNKLVYESVQQKSSDGRSSNYRSYEKLTFEAVSLSINENGIKFSSQTIEISMKKSFEKNIGPEIKDKDAFNNILNNGKYSGYTNQALYNSYISISQNTDKDYWSPDNTSKRIANMATSFGELWKMQNPEASEEELESFLNTLEESIIEGFSQAMDILNSFEMFSGGEIESNANKTLELTIQRISESFSALLGREYNSIAPNKEIEQEEQEND